MQPRQFPVHLTTAIFGLLELSKDRISRSQVGKANFVTMDLLVIERTKDTKRGYFGAHTLVGKNGTFFRKMSCSGSMS
jgi:hypothetical protein